MNLMSFNTQHCLNYTEQKIDFEIMAKAIKQCEADIAGLNEMRGKGIHPEYAAQTEILSGLTGIEHYYFAKALSSFKGPYGNALLSKVPIVSAETVPIPAPKRSLFKHYEPRCLLKAVLENGFTVIVTHFGLSSEEQKNAVQTVLDNIEDKKCILMGDFNITPDSDLLLPIKEHMKDTADVFNGKKLSFPSDKPAAKLDYIFVSSDIKILSADIPAIAASDHRPHTAVVR